MIHVKCNDCHSLYSIEGENGITSVNYCPCCASAALTPISSGSFFLRESGEGKAGKRRKPAASAHEV